MRERRWIDDMVKSVTRVLDGYCISYIVKLHHNDALTCEDVSRERNIPLSQVLKCMIGKGVNKNVYVMLLPGDKRLKIKKMRYMEKDRKIVLVSRAELTRDFGLTVGAITPIQFMGKAKFYIDKTALKEEYIDISAGSLNVGITLKTNDLIGLLNPTICDIISSK